MRTLEGVGETRLTDYLQTTLLLAGSAKGRNHGGAASAEGAVGGDEAVSAALWGQVRSCRMQPNRDATFSRLKHHGTLQSGNA